MLEIFSKKIPSSFSIIFQIYFHLRKIYSWKIKKNWNYDWYPKKKFTLKLFQKLYFSLELKKQYTLNFLSLFQYVYIFFHQTALFKFKFLLKNFTFFQSTSVQRDVHEHTIASYKIICFLYIHGLYFAFPTAQVQKCNKY